MPCYSPLKGFKDRETGGLTFDRSQARGDPMEVACGQCLGCRLDKSRMWATRMVHEASLHHHNAFITLTYSPENMPADYSLRKEDFQKFMKRLRKRHQHKIRFFHCGEYGNQCRHGLPVEGTYKCPSCNTGRPHYHAILFNHHFPDRKQIGVTNGNIDYTSAELEDTWQNGIVHVGDVTAQSTGYVARYCLKKVNGFNQDDHYSYVDPDSGEITWLQPEYATMSRRPGIGLDWLKKYQSDVYPSDEVPVPGVGVHKGTPRYYDDILAETDPALYEQVKAARLQFKKDHPEHFAPERLEAKYFVKKAQIATLTRELS